MNSEIKPAVLAFAFILPALRTVLFITAGILLVLLPPFKGMSLAEVSRWWILLFIIVNILTIGILFILIRRDGISFQTLISYSPGGIKKFRETFLVVLGMFILGVGGLMGFSYLVYGYMPVTNTQPLPVWAALIVLLLLPVTTALAEIPFYLGYCAPRIKSVTRSEAFSIIYPLFFYALQHSFMPLIFDWQHMVSRFIQFIPLLVILGIWYAKKRYLLPLMIGHGLLDTATAIQILVVSLSPGIYEMMESGLH